MSSENMVSLLSTITLLSNITLVLLGVLFIFSKLGFAKPLWKQTISFFEKNALVNGFIVALTAMLGSLYFSEIAGFEPCKLCWFQRIFMYPLVIILGIAWRKKNTKIWEYVLPLSLIGLLIASYHYYIQVSPVEIIPCSVSGYAASCTERFTTHFGYITIPWMALTAFTLISSVMLLLSPMKKWMVK